MFPRLDYYNVPELLTAIDRDGITALDTTTFGSQRTQD